MPIEIIFDQRQDVTHNVESMCETRTKIIDGLNQVINKILRKC